MWISMRSSSGRDLADIPLDDSRRAPACTRRVTVEPARTGVHGPDQHELGRESTGIRSSRGSCRNWFDWLAEQSLRCRTELLGEPGFRISRILIVNRY